MKQSASRARTIRHSPDDPEHVRVATSKDSSGVFGAPADRVSSSFSDELQQPELSLFRACPRRAAATRTVGSTGSDVNYFITARQWRSRRGRRAPIATPRKPTSSSSAEATRALVTNQYIASLKSQAQASLADSLVADGDGSARPRQRQNEGRRRDDRRHPHGRGRGRSGAGEPGDWRTTRRVIDKIRLFQHMGVPARHVGEAHDAVHDPAAHLHAGLAFSTWLGT